jgi:sodium transport system ATP-binding protein
MTEGGSVIEVRELRKRFGKVTAVDGVTCTAHDRSITGILGKNGAGKTTTLAMICGLVTPDAGSIQIDGEAASTLDVRRRVGALLDHHGLYPRLTARENIAYFGELQGLSRDVLPERVDEILNVLGLDRIADRPSGGFSQGERIKVALGRVLVHAPRNLLLDEVTNGLDIPTVRGLRTFLRGLRDDGRAIVFSSHVLDEIRALCDRIVVISHGKVVVQGSADEICRLTGAATLEDAFVAVTRGEEMPA